MKMMMKVMAEEHLWGRLTNIKQSMLNNRIYRDILEEDKESIHLLKLVINNWTKGMSEEEGAQPLMEDPLALGLIRHPSSYSNSIYKEGEVSEDNNSLLKAIITKVMNLEELDMHLSQLICLTLYLWVRHSLLRGNQEIQLSVQRVDLLPCNRLLAEGNKWRGKVTRRNGHQVEWGLLRLHLVMLILGQLQVIVGIRIVNLLKMNW